MIIVNYIYYSMYCFTTLKKEEGGYSRAFSAFTISTLCYIASILNVTGASTVLRGITLLYPIILVAVCILIFNLLLPMKKRERVVNAFESKISRWKRVHATIGFLYFLAAMILFPLTLKYIKQLPD